MRKKENENWENSPPFLAFAAMDLDRIRRQNSFFTYRSRAFVPFNLINKKRQNSFLTSAVVKFDVCSSIFLLGLSFFVHI
jgi:hypothetical protein